MVIKMLNLRKAVNMGRLRFRVPPRPEMMFPKNMREMGKISLMICQLILGMSIFLNSMHNVSTTTVVMNWTVAKKLK